MAVRAGGVWGFGHREDRGQGDANHPGATHGHGHIIVGHGCCDSVYGTVGRCKHKKWCSPSGQASLVTVAAV